ncbi:MAG TPA: hypothetical protein VN578_21120 [Candidatus Binatia bacterium]|jgi:hypothetical protein|nr:hypothetical protein [Candidatus Binatia bacterium]
MKQIRLCWLVWTLVLCGGLARADLLVKVDAPKQVGQKVVIKLTMKNTFKEKVESARAQVFLVDDKGKVAGQAVRWVIGGKKDRPALAPDAETTFNFVVETGKPFTTTKVLFSRVLLEGGKLAGVNKEVQIQKAGK